MVGASSSSGADGWAAKCQYGLGSVCSSTDCALHLHLHVQRVSLLLQ